MIIYCWLQATKILIFFLLSLFGCLDNPKSVEIKEKDFISDLEDPERDRIKNEEQ
jgi:hypothetical protein